MAVALSEMRSWMDTFLEVERFRDYAPNGLQIEGREEVARVVLGVSANQALIDQAIAREADVLLVHHGFFWRNEERTLIGHRRRRIASLLEAGISLIAYHLPLDAHPKVGNNVALLRMLGVEPERSFGGDPALGWLGPMPGPSTGEVLGRLRGILGSEGTVFADIGRPVRRIGVLSGGGAGFFEEAVSLGCDLFVTGEPSEQSQGLARELNAGFAAMGHHATERLGVQALGKMLSERFAVETEFIDVPNPV